MLQAAQPNDKNGMTAEIEAVLNEATKLHKRRALLPLKDTMRESLKPAVKALNKRMKRALR